MTTKIDWCDEAWNPTTGCSKVSAGCKNCYAERFAARHLPGWDGPRACAPFATVVCHEDRLDKPLRWRKPRKVLVNNMSDLFHEDVPFEFIDRVFAVMALCPQHTFLIPTKLPGRMLEYLSTPFRVGDEIHDAITEINAKRMDEGEHWASDHDVPAWPLPNVWLGVSVEDQASADARIPNLLDCPAARRFVSHEPALGAVDFTSYIPAEGRQWQEAHGLLKPSPPSTWLDLIIDGGETGPDARPAHPDWFRKTRDACEAAGVAYFHKHNGEWSETGTTRIGDEEYARSHAGQLVPMVLADTTGDKRKIGTVTSYCAFPSVQPFNPCLHLERVGKARAGHLLDGREHRAFPTPTQTAP